MKNKIFILEKDGERTYRKIGEESFKTGSKIISFKHEKKEHTIPFPSSDVYCFTTGKVNIMFFDLGNNEYVIFRKELLGLSTTVLDRLFNRRIIEQLAKAIKKAEENQQTNYSFLKEAIKLAVVFFVGYAMGSGLLNNLA